MKPIGKVVDGDAVIEVFEDGDIIVTFENKYRQLGSEALEAVQKLISKHQADGRWVATINGQVQRFKTRHEMRDAKRKALLAGS